MKSIEVAVSFFYQKKYSDAQKILNSLPQSSISNQILAFIAIEEKNFAKAEKFFLKALKLEPKNITAICNLAKTQSDQGKLDSSIKTLNIGLAIEKNSPKILIALGEVYLKKESTDTAIQYFKEVLKFESNNKEALNNIGVCLSKIGDYTSALGYFQSAISVDKNFSEAWSNKGLVEQSLLKHKYAVHSFLQSIRINNKCAKTLNNLGVSLDLINNFTEAESYFIQSIEISPNTPEFYNNYGNSLLKKGNYRKAINCFSKVLQINPDFPFGLGTLIHAKKMCCDWYEYDEIINKINLKINNSNRVIQPFQSLSLIKNENQLLKIAADWASYVCENLPSKGNLKNPLNKKIRIGYFSADFKNHPVSFQIHELIDLHDRNLFEIYGISLINHPDDELKTKLKTSFDVFLELESCKGDIIDYIRNLELDIAVDLTGYTDGCQPSLFFSRIAPIQIHYIGFLGTLGSKNYDYIVADTVLIPESSKTNYREGVIYLPFYQVNEANKNISSISYSKSDFGIDENQFVMCCLNNSYKLSPEIISVWLKILDKNINSVLVLYGNCEDTICNIKKFVLNTYGKEYLTRLFFFEPIERSKYFSRYKVCDLFLDTWPYGGGVTSSDALWCGVPVITLSGKTFSSRMGASLLTALNIPELITYTSEEYVSIASELSLDKEKYSALKTKLLKNLSNSKLFRPDVFTKNFELELLKLVNTPNLI